MFDFVVPNSHSFIANGFLSHNTDSWRLSSSEPNLENLPRPLEVPKKPNKDSFYDEDKVFDSAGYKNALKGYKEEKEEYDFWIQFEIRSLLIPEDDSRVVFAWD